MKNLWYFNNPILKLILINWKKKDKKFYYIKLDMKNTPKNNFLIITKENFLSQRCIFLGPR